MNSAPMRKRGDPRTSRMPRKLSSIRATPARCVAAGLDEVHCDRRQSLTGTNVEIVHAACRAMETHGPGDTYTEGERNVVLSSVAKHITERHSHVPMIALGANLRRNGQLVCEVCKNDWRGHHGVTPELCRAPYSKSTISSPSLAASGIPILSPTSWWSARCATSSHTPGKNARCLGANLGPVWIELIRIGPDEALVNRGRCCRPIWRRRAETESGRSDLTQTA